MEIDAPIPRVPKQHRPTSPRPREPIRERRVNLGAPQASDPRPRVGRVRVALELLPIDKVPARLRAVRPRVVQADPHPRRQRQRRQQQQRQHFQRRLHVLRRVEAGAGAGPGHGGVGGDQELHQRGPRHLGQAGRGDEDEEAVRVRVEGAREEGVVDTEHREEVLPVVLDGRDRGARARDGAGRAGPAGREEDRPRVVSEAGRGRDGQALQGRRGHQSHDSQQSPDRLARGFPSAHQLLFAFHRGLGVSLYSLLCNQIGGQVDIYNIYIYFLTIFEVGYLLYIRTGVFVSRLFCFCDY